MNSIPLISVVMGVYNGARYLRESVESILSQEGAEFEFLIVNDGSTDDSRKILEEYASQDHRIRLIHQENSGLTRALIRGCSEARAEFIARQDADDVSLPGRLAMQLARMRSEAQLAFCTSGIRNLAPDGESIEVIIPRGDAPEQTRRLLVDMIGIPAHGCVMFRKDAYESAGGYRWQFYYAQDCDLWLRLASIGKLASVETVLYVLQEHIASISSRCRGYQGQFAQIARQCHQARSAGHSEIPPLKQAERLRAEILAERILPQAKTWRPETNSLLLIAARLADRGDHRSAQKYYRRALRLAPMSARTWWHCVRFMLRVGLRGRNDRHHSDTGRANTISL